MRVSQPNGLQGRRAVRIRMPRAGRPPCKQQPPQKRIPVGIQIEDEEVQRCVACRRRKGQASVDGQEARGRRNAGAGCPACCKRRSRCALCY